MIIDHSGLIHVVWVYKEIPNYGLILYSFSTDNGYTWSEPLDLLQNNEFLMEQPHITCDYKNNLYLTYTHDNNGISPEGRVIKMLIHNGNQWSKPIIISEGLPGSNYSKIIIDQKGNPYIFWLLGTIMGQIDMYYRYYKENNWSSILCPFCDSTFGYLPLSPTIHNDMAHWAGVHQQIGLETPMYFKYITKLNNWTPPEAISIDSMLVDIDLDINMQDMPEAVYRKISASPPGIGFEGTMHTRKDNMSWLPPEMVSESNGSQEYQQLKIDQNNETHIVEVKQTDGGYNLYHFTRIKDQWVGQLVDSCYIVNFPKLAFNLNKLYLVYSKTWVVDKEFVSDLFFTKYDIITKIDKKGTQPESLKIFPNPTSNHAYIEFENKARQPINLSIFNMSGELITTLANEALPPGKQQILWNGTVQNGKKVQNGSYVVRLKFGRKTIAKMVEIVR